MGWMVDGLWIIFAIHLHKKFIWWFRELVNSHKKSRFQTLNFLYNNFLYVSWTVRSTVNCYALS